MVVTRKDEFIGRIDRHLERLASALRSRVLGARGRVHALESRRGLARVPATLAMRGRHISELAQSLRHAMSDRVARGDRRVGALTRQLTRYDPRARLAETRGRLKTIDARLVSGASAGRARLTARFGTLAGQLNSLSPLAVLGRGYAVCWDGTRTRIIRSATELSPGDAIRVTLADGEARARVDGE
jgi:exodeoxyribonuclease VII large subunit